jgi:hypothetical protein
MCVENCIGVTDYIMVGCCMRFLLAVTAVFTEIPSQVPVVG